MPEFNVRDVVVHQLPQHCEAVCTIRLRLTGGVLDGKLRPALASRGIALLGEMPQPSVAVGRLRLLGISEPGLCLSHAPLLDALLLCRFNRRGQLPAVDVHQVGDVEYGLERLLRHLPLRLSVTRGDGDRVAAHGRLEAVLALLLGRVEESLGTIEKRAGRDGHRERAPCT
eukprot:2382886-Prymnesium_polylepis.1